MQTGFIATPYKLTSRTTLKTSAYNDFRTRVRTTFGVSEDSINFLLPKKARCYQNNYDNGVITYSLDITNIISDALESNEDANVPKNLQSTLAATTTPIVALQPNTQPATYATDLPLFFSSFEYDGHMNWQKNKKLDINTLTLLPTLFALWRLPALLPPVYVPEPVVGKITGTNPTKLYTPGCLLPNLPDAFLLQGQMQPQSFQQLLPNNASFDVSAVEDAYTEKLSELTTTSENTESKAQAEALLTAANTQFNLSPIQAYQEQYYPQFFHHKSFNFLLKANELRAVYVHNNPYAIAIAKVDETWDTADAFSVRYQHPEDIPWSKADCLSVEELRKVYPSAQNAMGPATTQNDNNNNNNNSKNNKGKQQQQPQQNQKQNNNKNQQPQGPALQDKQSQQQQPFDVKSLLTWPRVHNPVDQQQQQQQDGENNNIATLPTDKNQHISLQQQFSRLEEAFIAGKVWPLQDDALSVAKPTNFNTTFPHNNFSKTILNNIGLKDHPTTPFYQHLIAPLQMPQAGSAANHAENKYTTSLLTKPFSMAAHSRPMRPDHHLSIIHCLNDTLSAQHKQYYPTDGFIWASTTKCQTKPHTNYLFAQRAVYYFLHFMWLLCVCKPTFLAQSTAAAAGAAAALLDIDTDDEEDVVEKKTTSNNKLSNNNSNADDDLSTADSANTSTTEAICTTCYNARFEWGLQYALQQYPQALPYSISELPKYLRAASFCPSAHTHVFTRFFAEQQFEYHKKKLSSTTVLCTCQHCATAEVTPENSFENIIKRCLCVQFTPSPELKMNNNPQNNSAYHKITQLIKYGEKLKWLSTKVNNNNQMVVQKPNKFDIKSNLHDKKAFETTLAGGSAVGSGNTTNINNTNIPTATTAQNSTGFQASTIQLIHGVKLSNGLKQFVIDSKGPSPLLTTTFTPPSDTKVADFRSGSCLYELNLLYAMNQYAQHMFHKHSVVGQVELKQHVQSYVKERGLSIVVKKDGSILKAPPQSVLPSQYPPITRSAAAQKPQQQQQQQRQGGYRNYAGSESEEEEEEQQQKPKQQQQNQNQKNNNNNKNQQQKGGKNNKADSKPDVYLCFDQSLYSALDLKREQNYLVSDLENLVNKQLTPCTAVCNPVVSWLDGVAENPGVVQYLVNVYKLIAENNNNNKDKKQQLTFEQQEHQFLVLQQQYSQAKLPALTPTPTGFDHRTDTTPRAMAALFEGISFKKDNNVALSTAQTNNKQQQPQSNKGTGPSSLPSLILHSVSVRGKLLTYAVGFELFGIAPQDVLNNTHFKNYISCAVSLVDIQNSPKTKQLIPVSLNPKCHSMIQMQGDQCEKAKKYVVAHLQIPEEAVVNNLGKKRK